MRYVYMLFTALLFVQCQSSGKQSTQENTRVDTIPVGKPTKKDEDSTQILQQIINLPQLQAYYHSDLPQRIPLVIENNKYVSTKGLLRKFNQAVVFLSKSEIVAKGKKAYLTIQSLDMNAEKQQATVIFAYAIEGVGGQVILNKVKGKWKVVKSSLYEK